MLCSAFTHADPKNEKNTVKPIVFFALLRSGYIEALCKMLLKLTPNGAKRNCSIFCKENIFRIDPGPKLWGGGKIKNKFQGVCANFKRKS